MLPRGSFWHQQELMVFHWNLSEASFLKPSGLPSVFSSILINAVVWIVSSASCILKTSSPFTNPLEIIASAPITLSITITFMFLSFFSSLARCRDLPHFSLSLIVLYNLSARTCTLFGRCSFLLTITVSGRLFKITWSVSISNIRELCATHSPFRILFFCIYHLCHILTSDPAINQGTGTSGRRYQVTTLTVDGLNWVQMWRSQEAGGCHTII